MAVILIKLLKDFRQTKTRFLLMVIAAALSAWGISSVLYSYQLAERDFQVNFARTFPADMEVVVENYQSGMEEKLLQDANVVDIERREVLGGSIQTGTEAWMPFVLYAVEDMEKMRMDVFRVLESTATSPRKLLIEQNALSFLEENQNSVRVKFPNKGTITWKIDGTSHDARLAPARMERAVFAHATSIDKVEPFLEKGQRRFLIETNASSDKKLLQEVAQRLQQIAKEAGSPITFVGIPEPGQHIHQNIVDGIAYLQQNMGWVLAIMGLVLLSLILLTWVLPQVKDIGIMKAIGASNKRLLYAYIFVFLLLVFLGLLIGMPLGYQTATLYNKMVAFVQNFEPVDTLLPLWVHLMVTLVCLIIPLVFAILPLSRATRTTARATMNRIFHAPSTSILGFTQQLFDNSHWKYCLNNLFRNSQRTFLLLLLIAVGIALFLTGVNLDFSVKSELAEFAKSAKYRLRARLSDEMKQKDIAFLDSLSFVKQVLPMKDKSVTYQPPNAAFQETKFIRFLSTKHDIRDEMVVEGKINKDCSDCLFISGEAMRQQFEGMALGATILLTVPLGENKAYTYAGRFKDMAAIGAPFFVFDDNEISSFNALAFETKADVSDVDILNSIDDAFLEQGIDLAGLMDVNRRLGQLQGHFAPTYLIIKIMGLLTILLGVFGLLIVLNLTIQERSREIGILKALGSSFPQLSNLFQLEFLLITLLAMGLGLLLSIPLTMSICRILTETVIFHPIPFAIDYKWALGTIGCLLLLQTLVIWWYNRLKIRQNAKILLDTR